MIYKKEVLKSFLLKLTLLSLLASSVFAYSGGTGEPNDPYRIADVNDLLALAAAPTDYSKCFILTADINMAGQVFTTAIIAPDKNNSNYYDFDGTAFTGTFDGNSHIICNVLMNKPNSFYIGLFGCVGAGGQIKNLGVEDANITGGGYVGGLVGYSVSGSKISNCYSMGSVGRGGYVGGLVGCNSGSVTNCYSTGSVSGLGAVGGLVGRSYSSITSCYSTSAVTGMYPAEDIGGLVGYSDGGSSISNCYSTGAVSGSNGVGGLVGSNGGSISDCYSAGAVSGSSDWGVGGLIGGGVHNINNSYFLDVAGLDNDLGEPLTNEQMKQQTSFINWDFSYTDGNEAVWFMPINEYPILTWQISPADIYTDGKNNFRDFAVFAQFWMRDDCRMYNNFCDWADLNSDGVVDIDDLKEFMSYWLQSGIYE